MNTQVLIVALLTVIIVMVVAGVYFMFFATSKKRREDGYAAVPDDTVVRVRAAVKGVNGRKVSFEADIDDIMPALEDLVQENDFRPLTDVERLFDPSTTEEEKLVIMKRMEDAGYEITYKGYDRERAAELERLEKGREDPSGGDGGAPEEGPDGDSWDGGPEDSPEDEAEDRYVPPVPEDYGEGEVDPLSGMSVVPGGDIRRKRFAFTKVPDAGMSPDEVAELSEFMDYVAEAFLQGKLSPELVLYLEKRFGVKFDSPLWDEDKARRAHDRIGFYEKDGYFSGMGFPQWREYVRKTVEAGPAKEEDPGVKEGDGTADDAAASSGAAPAPQAPAEEERDYSSLFIGKDGGKLDAMWDRLGPRKK